MRFFLDNNLSPRLSAALGESGFDVVHARDYQMQRVSDEEIFNVALKEDRIIISADTDFGFLLARWNKNKPSLILFRGFISAPQHQLKALLAVLKSYKELLMDGCIIVIEPKGFRIRQLPLY